MRFLLSALVVVVALVVAAVAGPPLAGPPTDGPPPERPTPGVWVLTDADFVPEVRSRLSREHPGYKLRVELPTTGPAGRMLGSNK